MAHASVGNHLIIEFWEVRDIEKLQNSEYLRMIFKEAALASKATILHDYVHHFGGDYGVTGVIALAESHISWHSYPETDYIAIDIFMCGSCDPELALEHLYDELEPGIVQVKKEPRGLLQDDGSS